MSHDFEGEQLEAFYAAQDDAYNEFAIEQEEFFEELEFEELESLGYSSYDEYMSAMDGFDDYIEQYVENVLVDY